MVIIEYNMFDEYDGKSPIEEALGDLIDEYKKSVKGKVLDMNVYKNIQEAISALSKCFNLSPEQIRTKIDPLLNCDGHIIISSFYLGASVKALTEALKNSSMIGIEAKLDGSIELSISFNDLYIDIVD